MREFFLRNSQRSVLNIFDDYTQIKTKLKKFNIEIYFTFMGNIQKQTVRN